MTTNQLYDKLTFDFDAFKDSRGTLSIASLSKKAPIPFPVERVFWITGVPEGQHRGMHAHQTCWEAVVAVNGRFSIRLEDGKGFKKEYILDSPQKGLIIPPMMWCELYDFTKDAVCLCFASGDYDKEGYISDYPQFLSQV